MCQREHLRRAKVNILAIDTGKTTGYAILRDGEQYSGIWKLASGAKDPSRWLGKFMEHLAETVVANRIDAIAFEKPVHHRGSRDAQLFGAWWGCLLLVHGETGIPLLEVDPCSLKSFATKGLKISEDTLLGLTAECGKLRLKAERETFKKKLPMMAAAIDYFHWRPSLTHDHNEADAVCLLHWAMRKLGVEDALPDPLPAHTGDGV
jgi:hypothetical protein